MAKQLSILLVASEVFPFSKESDVADVASSLALSLKDKGNDVRIMMPKYGHISERKNRIHDINRLRDMPIPINGAEDFATIKSSAIQNSRAKVQTYVTTNDNYFNNLKGVYHDPKTWKEFSSNAERFIFFSRSVVETCVILGWYPDIIHCNDWQTALVPAFAKLLYPDEFANTKFVFTAHDFNNQGSYPWSNFKKTGIPEDFAKEFKHKNKFNFLKAGLVYADFITTVSETYAEEVLSDSDFSDGLNTTLKARKKDFMGILNGIDKWVWNPVKDDYLKYKLEDDDFENFKYNNKVELLNNYGLEYHPKRPVYGMVTSFADEKGLELLIDSADSIFDKDLQLVILGQGSNDYKKKLEKIEKKYPDKFKVKYEFDETISHLIEAGSDFFLIPTKYETSGLSFMYSCTYGSIPIVNVSGGLNETVEAWDAEEMEGNALLIEDYSSDSITNSINSSFELFKEKDKWEKLAKNGMYEEFGWDENAEQYQKIYRKLLKK